MKNTDPSEKEAAFGRKADMFGKLSLQAIPFEYPITMGAVAGATLLGLVIVGLITYFRKWPYLWKEWL